MNTRLDIIAITLTLVFAGCAADVTDPGADPDGDGKADGVGAILGFAALPTLEAGADNADEREITNFAVDLPWEDSEHSPWFGQQSYALRVEPGAVATLTATMVDHITTGDVTVVVYEGTDDDSGLLGSSRVDARSTDRQAVVRVRSPADGRGRHLVRVYADAETIVRTELRLSCEERECLPEGTSRHTLDRSEIPRDSGHSPFFALRTFDFDGLAGQTVTVEAEVVYGGGSPELVMLDGEGDEASIVGYDVPVEGTERMTVEIPFDGTYRIQLSGADDSDYEVRLETSCDTMDLVDGTANPDRFCGML